uniref:NB-ARC domain-containing protein n=1 Tax=Fagus sylvatica TaxID=28930 RepID=A0A2N9IMD4_FAGSY
MAEGLVTDLIKQLASIAAREAEQEISYEEAVKLWLEKLKDACYEMDDVVDEWNTAMIKSEIQKHEEENAENALAVMKKIKELNEKLDEIVIERERYHFHELNSGNAPEVVERPLTTSLVDVSEMCGRDNVKDDLVNILLGKGSEEERSPHVISLVGMGGIGKTTLAQLAYNDPKVKGYFDKRIWVCVSEPFDQCRVAKAILEALGGDHSSKTELQKLLENICELIEGKKFFLVLDDVWTENSTLWEPFRLTLRNGAQGSRILATTRKSRVAEMMGSLKTSESMINLEMLSEEDCWLVFRKIAFLDRDPNQCEQLEDLGRKIAKKCKGLPLAAKTLGSLMRFQRSREEWEMVLDSSLWELEDVGRVVEKDLFGPLLLSYNDLPSSLKQCFSFCAVFPKDYVFHIDDLVYMWMAHGYIDSKEHMELKGREYFENLAIRSFFQDFKKDKDDEYPRGFGRLTSLRRLSHFYVSGTKDGCKLGELKDLNQLEGSLEIKELGNVVDACEAENAQLKKKIHLHTLKLQFTGRYDRRIENDVSVLNALESPPNLKYLSISWYEGTTMSPNWTMSLTKLKTLRLDYFKNLEHLPPLGKLPVLESLIITGFYSLRKVGVEFLGIGSENKKEDNMQIFPNLKSLEFEYLNQWEEWIGIGGKREEEEDSNITIMPRLQRLVILDCPRLNSLPDFLRTIPLKELEIDGSSILQERCERGTGEDWPKISHIPNIKIDREDVQRDGQEVK